MIAVNAFYHHEHIARALVQQMEVLCNKQRTQSSARRVINGAAKRYKQQQGEQQRLLL